MADYLIQKVAEIQYNKVIDSKKKPYVVLHTTLQSLTCVETLEMKPDWKRDDYLLTDMHREMDHEEPLPLGRDCMQPEPESKLRPQFNITMNTSSGSRDFERNPTAQSVTSKGDKGGRSTARKKLTNKLSAQLTKRDLQHVTSVQFEDQFSQAADNIKEVNKNTESKRDELSPDPSMNDDVDRQSIGQTSKGSGAVNRLPKKKTIKKEKKVEEVINYAERTYAVKPTNQDSEDEEFTAKLEELRVEVTKRDIQRKFEAMQNAPKGKFNRGGGI